LHASIMLSHPSADYR